MSWAGLGWLGWVSLVPLFGAIRLLKPMAAVLAGAWWGATLSLGQAWFVSNGPPAGILDVALPVSVFSLYVGLGSALTRRIGSSPLVLAVGWIGVELALQPLGWRHGLLAATQDDGSLGLRVAPLLGYVFVAFLVVYANASLVAVLGKARLRTPRQRSFATLPISEACSSSQTVLCLQFLALGQGGPRAPPSSAL